MSLSAEDGIAGVLNAKGNQVFVAGVPRDLPAGAVIRLRVSNGEIEGTVSIPPSLVLWRDPTASCADFVALVSLPAPPAPTIVEPPAAVFLAREDAPDEATLAAMLSLAQQERGRLDDA